MQVIRNEQERLLIYLKIQGLTMNRERFSEYMLISAIVFALITFFAGIVSASNSQILENKSNESSSVNYFSKIYVDGFSANSNGFKLLLRTYERHQETRFQPFLADIDFILIKDGEIIYHDTQEQISLLSEGQGTTEIYDQPHIALKEGKNYTALTKIYLHEGGSPAYYLTATSSFTAKNDATITEVYGDGIGSSATIKSKSLVPLNAKITFTLTLNGSVIESKEIMAPPIMSHDKEKTVNTLWDKNLDEGVYTVSVVLKGNDLVVKYDKVFTVEKKTGPSIPASTEQTGKSTPGFTSLITSLVIIFLYVQRGLKRAI